MQLSLGIGWHRLLGWASVLTVGVALAGCSSSSSSKLLEQPSLQAGPAQANLAIPPSDALVRADPNAPPDPNDEYDVGPGGVRSTPEELHSMPAPGIDAPKTAAGLEADLQTAKTQPNTMWRGQFGADGVDIVNVQGTLCTGLGNSSSGVHAARITLACSDGRVGQLQVVGAGGFSRVFFGSASEAVEMN